MWDAFAAMEVAPGPLMDTIFTALKRNIPGKTGGWKVNRGGKRGNRSR